MRYCALWLPHCPVHAGRLLPSSATLSKKGHQPWPSDPTDPMIGGSLRSSNHHLVGNARRDNSRAIDRAEKAAAAAAASEARSSSANAGPSVRGHSNIPSPHIPSPLLARLTTRSIAQRSGSKTALARLWRVARESVSSLLAAVRQVLPWIEVAHYLDKFGAPRRVSGSRTCARVSVGYRVARTRRRCGTVDLD